ncbi:hypothetical protein QYM36_004456 [Artemia franciscana]|uniref:MTP large subunit lipid-binding domain-containing protein n=1 Tax=Artemia franciscana TaxID=6661 RepID=A0AA88HYQ6_ARTSF|nr:hypothetical protein QYM36_004456 [Artemia franciscana]
MESNLFRTAYNQIFGIEKQQKSTVDYKFSGDGLVIDSLKAVETQRMEVAIRRQVGAQIYSNQTLVLKALKAAISILKTKYLSTESDTNSFIHLSKDPIDRIEEFNCLGSLLDAKCAAKFPATAQTPVASQKSKHLKVTAVMNFLDLNKEDDVHLIERYLMVLSLATNVPETIVEVVHFHLPHFSDLFKRAKHGVKVVKAAKSLDLCLAAVAHALSTKSKTENAKVLKEIESYITSKLKNCKNDECQVTQLRCLGNLKSDTTLPQLLDIVQQGGKLSAVALQSIKAFPIEKYSHLKKIFESVYLRLVKPYDSSAQGIAFDLLLNIGLNDDFLELVISQLGQKGEKELKKYVWSRLSDKAEKCEKFRLKLIKAIVKNNKNNYNALALDGLSTSFTRIFHRDRSAESGFIESMEIGGGLLKRSVFDVYVKNNQSNFDLLSGITPKVSILVCQATSLLFDHRELVPLQVGIAGLMVLYGSVSFDFAGQVQISLWYKTCNSLVENKTCYINATENAIFLDVKKTFNSLTHKILTDKLSYHDVRGKALFWFSSYLTDRSIAMEDPDEQVSTEYGVPQGSILGPTVFLIFE